MVRKGSTRQSMVADDSVPSDEYVFCKAQVVRLRT
jgi:hypothetical protein